MAGLDLGLLDTAWLRLVLVATSLATFMSGFSIRHDMRAAGWPPWRVRLATAVTWTVALVLPGRLLLLLGDGDPDRTLYWALFALSVPIIAFWAFGLDATRRAIDRRPSRRVALFAALDAIQEELSTLESDADREHVEQSLADLDRFLEPATFEAIHLTRSRILSWLDGGPRAAIREARWSARMTEVSGTLRPASWWHADPWQTRMQTIRSIVLSRTPWLAAASGLVLGRSVLSGPSAMAMPAAIVAGYLLTWEWSRTATVLLGAASVGLVVTATAQASLRSAGELATTGLVALALGGCAAIERRRARGRPDLRVVSSFDEPTPSRPRAS